MSTADAAQFPSVVEPGGAEQGPASRQRVRVKLFVHGGTITFSMAWSSSLGDLWQFFTKNLAPRSGGIVVESSERFVNITHGSISAYEFSKEPAGSGGELCEVRLA